MSKRTRTRADLAEAVSTTYSWLSEIANGNSRPSWDLAKRLAAETGTTPNIWMDGNVAAMQSAIVCFLYAEPKDGGPAHEAG